MFWICSLSQRHPPGHGLAPSVKVVGSWFSYVFYFEMAPGCAGLIVASNKQPICFSKWRSSVLGWWNINIIVIVVCVYIYYVAFKRINWLWNHPIWNQPHGILVQTPFSFSFQLSKPTLKEVQGVGRVRGEKKPVLADAPWRSNVERMVKRCGTGFLGNETSRRKSHSICQWKQILSSLLQYIFIATYNMWFGLCTETRRNRGFFSKKLT